MRRLAPFVVLGALMLASPAGATGPDSAGPQKAGCDSIKLGEKRVFYKHNMDCKRAKRYARRLYKTDGEDEPRRFDCQSGTNFDEGGACHHKTKDKYFGWHPAD